MNLNELNATAIGAKPCLKGIGIQLGISTNLDATTAQYVDVRLDRIRVILQTYHNEILPEKQLDTKKEHTHRKDELVK